MVSPKTNAAQLNHSMAQQHIMNTSLRIKEKQHPINSKQARRNRQSAMVALLLSQASGIQ
jgi:hypothetical protein